MYIRGRSKVSFAYPRQLRYFDRNLSESFRLHSLRYHEGIDPARSGHTVRNYYGVKLLRESRDTLESITLFITVKAITELNLGHHNKSEKEFQKISCRSSRSSDNAELVISRCCLAEDDKEIYKDV